MPRTIIMTVGRRKTAIARVRVNKKDDTALTITINEKPLNEYFPFAPWQDTVLAPLKKTGQNTLNLSVRVSGGGVQSQAEAIRHGISRALLKIDGDLRATLKKEGFLTRDPRQKERKKPGLKKARRAPQWSKR